MRGDNLDLGVSVLVTMCWITGMGGNHFGGKIIKMVRNSEKKSYNRSRGKSLRNIRYSLSI